MTTTSTPYKPGPYEARLDRDGVDDCCTLICSGVQSFWNREESIEDDFPGSFLALRMFSLRLLLLLLLVCFCWFFMRLKINSEPDGFWNPFVQRH